MSKIQISQLNNTALEVLNNQETSTVVGGRGDNNSRRTVNRNRSRINAPSNLLSVQVGRRNRADIINGAVINVNQQSDQG